ncbi:hypothetical protein EGT74_03825 [Chitinophaga lutea]|uniref:Uncharacterized protein n=1 Tax=Chitinophaga lutea TaxID=2488634 RepID=A0A3N4PZ34_9BACT|nr:hypothetical protein [Chitinophaga lutea]RPE12685.1 hypothetical protein EGT74_03825 [Chitinophaga lutea]
MKTFFLPATSGRFVGQKYRETRFGIGRNEDVLSTGDIRKVRRAKVQVRRGLGLEEMKAFFLPATSGRFVGQKYSETRFGIGRNEGVLSTGDIRKVRRAKVQGDEVWDWKK